MKTTIIYALLPNNKKIFISSLDKREDNKLIAIPTFEVKEAKTFESEQDAAEVIPFIHNPLDRNWKVGIVEVEKKKNIVKGKNELV
ncbi:hypothetical protein ACFS6H_19875 [Terrimonas rubra]|uniref:Uncharacterized protein n=1 Tax=Terrimonas rubra TaxID=1035890 RepID=A0ABW6A9E9_9BACT